MFTRTIFLSIYLRRFRCIPVVFSLTLNEFECIGKYYLLSRKLDSSHSNCFWKFVMPPPLFHYSCASHAQLLDNSGTNKGHRQENFRDRYQTNTKQNRAKSQFYTHSMLLKLLVHFYSFKHEFVSKGPVLNQLVCVCVDTHRNKKLCINYVSDIVTAFWKARIAVRKKLSLLCM